MSALPSSPAEWALAVFMTLVSGGVIGAVIDWVRNRGKPRAEVTAIVSQAAAETVRMLTEAANEAQIDAAEAQKAAKAARAEAEQAQREMRTVRLEMELLVFRFRRLVGAIHDDNMSREDLKALAYLPGQGEAS